MAYTRRRRELPGVIPGGKLETIWAHTYPETVHVNEVHDLPGMTYAGFQVTDSKGNPWRDRKGPLRDIGGDFYTRKRYLVLSGGETVAFRHILAPPSPNECWKTYRGPLYAAVPTGGGPLPDPSASALTSLDALGAVAVAACKPTNAIADASVTLGEIMSGGIPAAQVKTWESRASRLRDVGSDYLNVEFGWRPLVSEINNFAKAAAFADTLMSQYERDAGKVVRRRFQFPSTKTASTVESGAKTVVPVLGSDLYIGGAVSSGIITSTEVSTERWFSGAFTYHLPVDYVQRKAMAEAALQAKVLFGLDLSPETLWNLTPWSWAVDWVANLGDVISNLSDWSSDGLVMRYGYVMEKSVTTTTITQKTNRIWGSPVISPTIVVDETKKRRRANPFGFGITWEGLTPRQLAIAAALGITKLG